MCPCRAAQHCEMAHITVPSDRNVGDDGWCEVLGAWWGKVGKTSAGAVLRQRCWFCTSATVNQVVTQFSALMNSLVATIQCHLTCLFSVAITGNGLHLQMKSFCKCVSI